MSDEPIKPDPYRKPKRPRDANQLAKNVVDLATGQTDEVDPNAGKDPAAVEKGRAGGVVGGRVRSERLSPEDRSRIAREAATVRWSEQSGRQNGKIEKENNKNNCEKKDR